MQGLPRRWFAAVVVTGISVGSGSLYYAATQRVGDQSAPVEESVDGSYPPRLLLEHEDVAPVAFNFDPPPVPASRRRLRLWQSR